MQSKKTSKHLSGYKLLLYVLVRWLSSKALAQTEWPEFDPWNPHKCGRREVTPQFFLTFTCVSWCRKAEINHIGTEDIQFVSFPFRLNFYCHLVAILKIQTA